MPTVTTKLQRADARGVTAVGLWVYCVEPRRPLLRLLPLRGTCDIGRRELLDVRERCGSGTKDEACRFMPPKGSTRRVGASSRKHAFPHSVTSTARQLPSELSVDRPSGAVSWLPASRAPRFFSALSTMPASGGVRSAAGAW